MLLVSIRLKSLAALSTAAPKSAKLPSLNLLVDSLFFLAYHALPANVVCNLIKLIVPAILENKLNTTK